MSIITEGAPDIGVPVESSELLAFGDYVAPRANLLPPEIAEKAALRRLQVGLAVAVLACGGIVGALYETTASGRAPARAALAQSQTELANVTAQQKALAPSQVAHQKVLAAKQSMVAAMGSEVLWSTQLDALRRQLPAGVRLSSLAVTGTSAIDGSAAAPTAVKLPAGPAGTSTAATSPATAAAAALTPAIATVVMSGTAVDNNAVANWLEQLARLDGWSDVYLTNTSAGATAQTVQFSITANITDKALSHRYTNGS
jgi:Tfp pilus assembly protein PilN